MFQGPSSALDSLQTLSAAAVTQFIATASANKAKPQPVRAQTQRAGVHSNVATPLQSARRPAQYGDAGANKENSVTTIMVPASARKPTLGSNNTVSVIRDTAASSKTVKNLDDNATARTPMRTLSNANSNANSVSTNFTNSNGMTTPRKTVNVAISNSTQKNTNSITLNSARKAWL